jgi:hypothetical protein
MSVPVVVLDACVLETGAHTVTVVTWNLKDFDFSELVGHGLAAAGSGTAGFSTTA